MFVTMDRALTWLMQTNFLLLSNVYMALRNSGGMASAWQPYSELSNATEAGFGLREQSVKAQHFILLFDWFGFGKLLPYYLHQHPLAPFAVKLAMKD